MGLMFLEKTQPAAGDVYQAMKGLVYCGGLGDMHCHDKNCALPPVVTIADLGVLRLFRFLP